MVTAKPAYPGPKHLGPELERLRREGLPCDSDWVEYCLGCHRCDLACPNQVNVAELIAEAKARHKKPAMRKMRDFWLARPALLGKILSVVPQVSNAILAWFPVRWGMSRFLAISAKRSFPAYHRPFTLPQPSAGQAPSPILFFAGCAIRYNQPDLGQSVVSALEAAGFAVTEKAAGCCGLPALANGDIEEARQRAKANIDLLAEIVDSGTPIIAACTSCGHMLKAGWPSLFEGKSETRKKAERIAAATYDLGEFLVTQKDKAGGRGTATGGKPLRLAYHAPCHQLSQGIGRPWYRLLQELPSVSIVDLNAGCCGMSGTFGFKEEKYETSLEVGERLFEAIRQAKPDFVVSECATCRMQIEHATKVRTLHPVQAILGMKPSQRL
jgi:glycerol-3-phosphate dehydrogenase subunit C